MNHPVDELVQNDGVTMAVLLAPVLCIDCGQFVPFGWVESGTVKCPENWGGPGGNSVQYGHRVPQEVWNSVKDKAYNDALCPDVAPVGNGWACSLPVGHDAPHHYGREVRG